MKFGVGIMGSLATSDFVQYVKEIESLGYDNAWIADERFWRDPYVSMTACALNTNKLTIGTSVTNPYTRYPAITAAAMASVDEVSAGRAVLGIAAGGSNHRMLGIKREKPALAVREAVTVFRRLLAGDKFTFEGKVVQVYEAEIDFTPLRSKIPVYIAARGPLMLRLAGEIGDGVIIGGFTSAEGIKYALSHVQKGAEKAGRSIADLEIVAWLYASVSDDDPGSAKRAVSDLVMISIINSRPILSEIGVELPDKLKRALQKNDWRQDYEYMPEYIEALPQELIDQFSLAGTVDDCISAVRRIASLGVDQLAILPFPPTGKSNRDVVATFKREVAARAFPHL
ncbi:MAG TPA: LLM class flavin-dependent oxidoreductase [bacterium]|nr:LLM class flavin-dependent oxidoreductase [bacterium]